MINQSYDYNLGLAFYSVARDQGSRVAFYYPDGKKFTYAEVDQRSNQIARSLVSKGFRPGDVLAIFNDKSPEAYCSMLACLKIGVIYTNLDQTNPWERLKKIIATCSPRAVFYDNESFEIIREIGLTFSDIDCIHYQSTTFKSELDAFGHELLLESKDIHGGMAAYIMFTSGSTGFPKGAVMSHSNVLNFIQWGRQTFGISGEDVFTNVNPIYFDNSVFDFYTSIFSGATLVPLDAAIVKNPKQLVQAINDAKCTIWFSVPSLLVYLLTTKALSEGDFQSVRRIGFGGEGFPKNKLKQLYDLFGKRIALYNIYGPTECTCICSSYLISERDFENMTELAPLGFMSPNFGYEIIPAEVGSSDYGELALTGPCVGMGYYNDADRTAKSFVQNPLKSYDERMYKTGDIVERSENGYLYFKGRVDNQIKHMGYRIELEEVEAAFSSLPYINEVGVIYEKITPELGQIKAFISVAEGSKDLKDIQVDVKGILPTYMIPKIFVLEALPKNRNGKIDRKQLATIK
ncbi:AMP-binding protein [soil metagenome]